MVIPIEVLDTIKTHSCPIMQKLQTAFMDELCGCAIGNGLTCILKKHYPGSHGKDCKGTPSLILMIVMTEVMQRMNCYI